MKRPYYIVLFLLLSALQVYARQVPKQIAQPRLTVEEQMRLDYYYYAALTASDQRRHTQAYFLLEYCYQIDSCHPGVCELLGSYIEQLYDAKRALPLYKRAYEGSPNDYWYRYVIASFNEGDRRTAMSVLQTLEKKMNGKQDDLEDVLTLHERILRHEKKFKQALAIRDKIDKLTGEPTAYSTIQRYEIYMGMNQNDKATQVLDDYLKRNPDDSRIRITRENLRLRDALAANDRPTARAVFHALLASPDVALSQKEHLIQQYTHDLGYGYREHRSFLVEMTEQYPFEQESHEDLMLFEAAMDNLTEARNIGALLLKMNPTDNELRKKVFGYIQQDTTASEKDAKAFVEESYAVLPDDAEWGLYKAIILYAQGNTDSTLAVLAHAAAYAEEPSLKLRILELQGDLLSAKQRYEEAFAAYEEALQINPEALMLLNNYAYTLALYGDDLKKAEQMSQKTIMQEANNPTYLDTYAWILHLRGENTLALFYMKKALENSSTVADDQVLREHYEVIRQAVEGRNDGVDK